LEVQLVKAHNIEGYREAARRSLPRAVFDFIDGGSDDEVTLRANQETFASLRLRYRVHETQDPVDLSTTLCEQEMSMPVMLSPAGNNGLFHPAGDYGMAKVASELGLIMLMSGGSSYAIEEVAAAATPIPWYQLYAWRGRDFYTPIIDRVAAAGFRGLVVTMDTPLAGNRERDIANVFTPSSVRLTRRNAWDVVRHPRWTMGVLKHRRIVVRTFAEQERPGLRSLVGEAKRTASQMATGAFRPTWDEIAWMRETWRGPFGVKGIVDPGDARRAVDIGADVIYVSNHGGRQLDSAPGAVEALPAIVDAVGGDAEVVLDGGIRRGTDVIKALCLGARAVSVGRPWVYGLAAEGPPGATRVLEGLRRELMISMTLLGQTSVKNLDRSWLMRAGFPDDLLAEEARI
jgi:isopentenyl diphosphate isomerase/L-lactate dehydrogenase-like FMN-dependent dehydrogenase